RKFETLFGQTKYYRSKKIIMSKKCLKCNIIKDINCFEKDRNQCRKCKAKYAKKRYYEKREIILQKQRDKYNKEYYKEYYEKNKNKINKRNKKYKEENKEKKLKADRLYRLKNKDKILKSRKGRFKIYNLNETFKLKQAVSGSIFKSLR